MATRLLFIVWPVVRPFAIAYLLILLLMTFLERWLVYPVPPANRGDWQPQELDYEDAWFASADGTRLHGWFAPHPSPRFGLVYCHGNGEHVADNDDLVAELRDELQASVFIFDYRGYGRSDGTPHEAGIVADGLAAQEWVARRMDVPLGELVLMGRSIGAGVAVAMAAKQGARALILQNAFSRMTDAAARIYPWLPVRWLMRNRFDSIARIQHYDGPLHQCHGTADRIVPIDLGRQLFETAPSKKKAFFEMPGLGHNDWMPPRYYDDLAAFLQDL